MGNTSIQHHTYSNEGKSLNRKQSNRFSINDESTKDATKLNLTQGTGPENKVVKIFEWTEKAKEVFLVGSFSNWQKLIKMNYDSLRRVFYCEVDLSEGVYFYKFIVDGKITISKDQIQRVYKEGEISNFIAIKKGLSKELLMINTNPTIVPCIYENVQNGRSATNVIVDHLMLSADDQGSYLEKGLFKAAVISRVRNKTIVVNYYK